MRNENSERSGLVWVTHNIWLYCNCSFSCDNLTIFFAPQQTPRNEFSIPNTKVWVYALDCNTWLRDTDSITSSSEICWGEILCFIIWVAAGLFRGAGRLWRSARRCQSVSGPPSLARARSPCPPTSGRFPLTALQKLSQDKMMGYMDSRFNGRALQTF